MSKKRIAITSNYDRDNYTERFLEVPPMDESLAWEVCHLLNAVNPEGPDYYQPKDPDYQLYVFQP